jgi:localization factor PodJL
MKFGVPWKVKGIRPEARETAREAARRSGMSVGEWLNSVIIESAVEEGVRPKRRPYESDEDSDDDTVDVLHERIDELTRQLERLAEGTEGRPSSSRRRSSNDDEAENLTEAIARLDRRLDQLIAQGRAAPAETERRGSEAGGPWPSGIDQAIAEITARQQALDADPSAPPSAAPARVPAQNLSGLEQQLRHITTQIEALRQPAGLTEGIAALRGELSQIARTITEAMPRRAIEAVESEVRALAGRLDSSRNSAIDPSALGSVERGLVEVRDALRVLTPAESLVGFHEAVRGLSQKIDILASTSHDPAAFQQLEAAISTLRGILSHVASNEALGQLAGEVRELATKIDQISAFGSTGGGGSDALGTLERRINHIADALEARTQSGGAVPPQLEAVIKGLSDKIERIQLSRGDNMALDHLEDRIVKLVEKLDASGARFSQLEAIERGLADLLLHIEKQGGAPAGAGQAGAHFDGLQRDISRTQTSLEAVHGTLGQVVDRLALIETGMRSEPQPRPVMPPAARLPLSAMRLPETPAVTAPANPPSRAAAAAQAAAAMARANPQAARRVIDPNLPPDHPLEPGSGTSRGRASASPAARIAASEADLGPAKPPVIPDPGGKSNFIAAARRAAQAAASAEPSPSDLRAVVDEGKRAEKSLRKTLAQRVRSLFVGTSVLLIAVGCLRIAAPYLAEQGSSPETRPAKQAEAKSPGKNSPQDTAALKIGPTASPKTPSTTKDAAPEVTGSVQQQAPAWMPQGTPLQPPSGPRPPGGDKLPATMGGSVLRTAAAAGVAAAEYEVGLRYADGRGVPVNYAEAARWLELAAKQGLAPAQFRLGGLYEKGTGVKKDLELARRFYRQAADKGHAKAMHNLAVLYAEGIDGKPDYKAASEWFRKAASYGVTDSQYNLAILFARGIGVQANLAESYRWFALAAANGDSDAAKKRDEVAARLDPKTLGAAKLAAQSFAPEREPDEAVNLKTPPGGWDHAPAAPAKPRR